MLTSANIATPSLSYEPATLLEMYDGITAMKSAAKSPASALFVHSLVKKYADIAVKPENTGARKTQMFLISIGKAIASRNH